MIFSFLLLMALKINLNTMCKYEFNKQYLCEWKMADDYESIRKRLMNTRISDIAREVESLYRENKMLASKLEQMKKTRNAN